MENPEVSILILNWNGEKFLKQFLPSVLSTQYPNFKIFVADNGSSDGSLAVLKNDFPLVNVIELGENHGFAKGNNLGLDHIDSPYFVLLNSDVEVHPNWLGPLVEQMEKNGNAAAAQPKLLQYSNKDFFEYAGAAGGFMDALGYPFCRGRIFDVAEKDISQYEKSDEIFWSSGACMIVRKSVTNAIGLFEERLFAHHEEIDFCWNAKNHGYAILYCPQSKVWHVGGGTLSKENPRKTFLNVRNSLISMLLNFPSTQLFWKIPARLTLDGIWGIKDAMNGKFKTIPIILKAHWAFYKSIPYWLTRRKIRRLTVTRTTKTSGYYSGSIVWQHFIKKKKTFGEIFGSGIASL